MFHKWLTQNDRLVCAVVAGLAVAGCVGGGGGGAGGGGTTGPTVVSAGAAGDKCKPDSSSGGCSGQKPMVCAKDSDSANTDGGKWAPVGAECTGDEKCTTAYDLTAKVTKAECKAPPPVNTGTDTSTASDTSTAGDTPTSSDATTGSDTTTGSDGVTSGDAGGLDPVALVKCVTSKCPTQVGACKSDSKCGAVFVCAEKCKDETCFEKCGNIDSQTSPGKELFMCMMAQKCIPDVVMPVCGNGQCESGETASSCSKDCKTTTPVCGNGKCDSGETATTCAKDCAAPPVGCGDGKCASGETCPMDCNAETAPTIACGWTNCKSQMAACAAKKPCIDYFNCMASCKCDAGCQEECGSLASQAATEVSAATSCVFSSECPVPCAGTGPKCGNGTCESGETTTNCPSDCKTASKCGNGVCDSGETMTNCPADCKTAPKCGNGTCESGETASSCPADCKAGTGHVCDTMCGKGANGCYCDAVCLQQGDCCSADGTGKAPSCAGSTCTECNKAP
ncbi:MAG: hypothetical protein EXR77_15585 [Myxococcales bacterium]|nr:hypothetical protein [Myxococcales bacterium]